MPRKPDDISAWRYPSAIGARKLAAGSPALSPVQKLPVAGQVVFPPTVFSPREAQYFFPSATTTLTGAFPAAGSFANLARFDLPQNDVGVIREITLLINNILVSTDVRFFLRFNDSAVPGFAPMVIGPRAAASVSSTLPPESTLVRIPDGSKVDVRIEVHDAGTYQMTVSYRGWHYSKEVANRYPHE